MMSTLCSRDSLRARPVFTWSRVKILTSGAVFMLCLSLGIVPTTMAMDDSYIAGYAAAVLSHEFDAPKASLHVEGGIVIVDALSLGTADRIKVKTALERIPGVVRVEISEDQAHTEGREPAPIQQEPAKSESKFLPHGLLVTPFHADPRWPHFSMASRQAMLG